MGIIRIDNSISVNPASSVVKTMLKKIGFFADFLKKPVTKCNSTWWIFWFDKSSGTKYSVVPQQFAEFPSPSLKHGLDLG
jgi:hypothetical protein